MERWPKPRERRERADFRRERGGHKAWRKGNPFLFLVDDPLEGKFGASSRGNSRSNSVVRSAFDEHQSACPFCRRYAPGLNWPGRASGAVILKKLECSKQAYALYTLSWDNIIGFRSYCVGLRD
ncbi:hypothetical protein YC2023_098712 [Brassica napus]